MSKIEKVGIVVTFNLSAGGGGPHVVIDLINALHDLKKQVYLLTPFNLDYKKIKSFYGKFKIEKVFYPQGIKKYFCRESTTSRLLMIKEFQEMANEVDLIIDIDGGVLHNYIPKNKRYLVWRISCVYSELEKFPLAMKMGWKARLKYFIKDLFNLRRPKPSAKHNVHAVDKWTEKEMVNFWNLKSAKPYLYPEIKVKEFQKGKKKNQIIIFGRIVPNKQVDKSIKVFAKGTEKFKDYRLIIMGGESPDTKYYIDNLNEIIKELNIENKVEIIKSPGFEKVKFFLSESKVIIESQEQVSMTMPSIEAMSSGCIVLAVKNSGTYLDILENGKYGFGFQEIEDGSKMHEKILNDMEKGKIN